LCRTYEIVGAEALIRWKKPDGSFVYPDEFIPAFESNGCIRKTDYFVYESVFKYLKDRLDKGLYCVPISMNVSRIHLFNDDFVSFVDGLLKKYEVPAELIEFELTESICLEGLPSVSFTMQWLRQKNIRISIDDFGSGYSSLEILTRLPINVLKLDKVFMKDFLNDNEKIVIASIVEMARLLGLEVICEGVEEDKQRIFLIEAACEMLQGYVFSKPVPMEEFSEKLARESRDREP
jgi:EAL domain-containing protein (putative c-di-GMP-specific phosphodiesterase class I)